MLGEERDRERSVADVDGLLDGAAGNVDDRDLVRAAHRDIGGCAVSRESDAARQRMAGQLDTVCLLRSAGFGEGLDEDTVGADATRLTGPQFAIAGPEGDAGIRRAAGLDFPELRAGERIEQQDGAR